MNENVTKLQEMYAAFGRGDINAILENVTEDVDWGTETVATEVPWYGVRRGREQVADFFATLAREVEFEKFEPSAFAAAGDVVYVNIDYTYKFRKNGRGTASTGVHRFHLREGKVAKFREFEDTATVREAWNS